MRSGDGRRTPTWLRRSRCFCDERGSTRGKALFHQLNEAAQPQRAQGTRGTRWWSRRHGPKGPKGEPGTLGTRDDAGPKGEKGESGSKGATGATGATGPANIELWATVNSAGAVVYGNGVASPRQE
jgi:hypothetical protein